MSNAEQAGPEKPPALDDAELRAIARKLFIAVDMVRVAEADYEVAVKVLRGVYDRGRSRGHYEAQEGARC
jgi:hypothetical protein